MQARIGNWGGSAAVRLPKSMVEALGLEEGEDVEFTVKNNALIIRSLKPTYTLEALVNEARKLKAPVAFDQEPIGYEAL